MCFEIRMPMWHNRAVPEIYISYKGGPKMFFIETKRIAVVIFGSLLLAVSLNFFFINANVYASGFAGAAQIVSSVLG